MALTRQQKEAQLAELKDKWQKAVSIVFTQYIGLKVADVSTLRRKLKERQAEMKVAKKTLIQLAARELQAPKLTEEMLAADIACIFASDEPTAGASVAFAFSKEHPQMKLVGGLFGGRLFGREEILSFAQLPPRPLLLATFAGLLRSPLTTFARAINTPLSSFARATAELAKKKAQPA